MRWILGLVVAVATVLAACGDPSGPVAEEVQSTAATQSEGTPASRSPATPSPSRTSSDEARRGLMLMSAGSVYGPTLFDRSGQAIYLFDDETTGTPECYGVCAEAWPPVLTGGPPRASGSVRSELLGTTRRRDGSRQVTYAGHPLYFYAHDGKNEVLCHNVSEFGGLWLVITPAAEAAA